jgi:hypothetical protein
VQSLEKETKVDEKNEGNVIELTKSNFISELGKTGYLFVVIFLNNEIFLFLIKFFFQKLRNFMCHGTGS